MHRLQQALLVLLMAVSVVLPFSATRADDLDIYITPVTGVDQAPITMLALDLNLLDVGAVACTNILLPPPVPPAIADVANADCLGLQELLTGDQLLDIVGTLDENLIGGLTGVLISTLPPSLLNQSLASLLQTPSLLTPIFNTVGSLLASNDLLGSLTSTLPVYLALSNILRGLVDTRVGILLNHSDQAAAAAPARCGFLDESSLGGERQDTPACSNGGYVFLGLVDPTRVDQLLTRLLPLLTNAVGNLLAGGNAGVGVGVGGSVGSGGTGAGASGSGLLGSAPYQTKELYAEFMNYLVGGPIYNGKLDDYDNALARVLARDQGAQTETADHRRYVSQLGRYPQACNINLLHVQLTPAAEQDDSDDELLRLMPDLRRASDGSISLASVVSTAADNSQGFVYENDRRNINSYFLVQEAVGNLGDLTAVSNLGANVTTYSNLLGLVGRGRDIAGAINQPLSVDTSLSSLTVAASRSSPNGILDAAYVPAFRADAEQRPDWPGNLKRLRLQRVAGENPKGLLEAVDARNPSQAALAGSGRILANALTIWTDASQLGLASADGPVANLGGAGQNIPGYRFGGGGNPGRSNPAAPAATARTLFYDGTTGEGGARLKPLHPDDATVRSELAAATSAAGFSSGNSLCSSNCNEQASTCVNQCSGNQTSCSNLCVGNQNTCNSSCGVGQADCATSCGSSLASCIATVNARETSCNSTAASNRAQCNSNAEAAQSLCVAPAALIRTTCNTTALTAKTARDVLCLGNASCLANSNTTYNAALATCTANYNSTVTPCTTAYNNSITACTNTFNAATAQCTATRSSDIAACNATNGSCTSGCNSNASTCGLTCGIEAGSCTNICTGNNSSCNDSCSVQLGSCQAACGVDSTRSSDTETKELLLYARGFDVGTLGNPKGSGATAATRTDSGIGSRPWMMGAVLHSRPVAINYGRRNGAATDDVRVVFGAADGYLRMVDDRTGVETWGFMPQATMSNLRVLRENVPGSALPYGVDGAPVVLIRDKVATEGANKGKLGLIDADDGDRVLLFFGLRRGGSQYYALDVTNPDSPRLVWRLGPDGLITAGQTAPAAGTATQFEALGLAFSTPQVARIRLGVDASGATLATPKTRTVLIFGGGYNGGRIAGAKVGKDLNNSRNTLASARVGRDDGDGSSDRGNAVFMIDAGTGELIWRAVRSSTASASYSATGGTRSYAHPMLADSIPSDFTVLDTDNDGFSDRFYVGDTGGRLWRGDFAGVQPSAWTLTPLASVGRHNTGSGNLVNDRRIFFAPDYVPVRNKGNTQGSDLILFGTGDREDPLNLTTVNSFYALRDGDLVSGKAAAEIITAETDEALAEHADFLDVTAAGGAARADISNLTQKGYRVQFARSGEKHFSAPVTLAGNTTFTSYVPPDASAAGGRVCAPTEGTSRLYSLATRTGDPRGINNATQTDRDIRLADGLPGEVNTLAGTQQAAGGKIYAIPANDTYRASWRERLGETQK